MKVLMVIDRYVPLWGGAENQLRQLAPRLVSLGCTVNIVTRRWHNDMSKKEFIDGIFVERVGIPGVGIASTLVYILNLSWYLLTKAKTADVIHTHGAAVLGAGGSLFARFHHIRNVALIGTAERIPKLRRNIFGPMLLSILKKSDAVISLSGEISKELKDIHAQDQRIFRIDNAVDTERFRPFPEEQRKAWRTKIGLGPDDPIVVFSGRLVYRKGLDLLLDAWAIVVRSCPRARLMILGSGSNQQDSVEAQMREKVTQENINNVYFEGQTTNPEIYFGVADIFVLSSRKEGMPNVLLEAMASSLASVCSKIGGPEDLVKDGQTGLLVSLGDVSGFAGKIINLINDPQRCKVMGAQAREYVLSNHGFDKIAKQYFDVYQG